MVAGGDHLQNAHRGEAVRSTTLGTEKVGAGYASKTDGIRETSGGGKRVTNYFARVCLSSRHTFRVILRQAGGGGGKYFRPLLARNPKAESSNSYLNELLMDNLTLIHDAWYRYQPNTSASSRG